MDETRDDHGRRRLTDHEREELLSLPLTAIFSTLTAEGRIHSVPVRSLPTQGEFRVLTEPGSAKCRNAARSGRATLCVEMTIDGADRRYVSAEGPVTIEQPPSLEDLAALNSRYGWYDGGEVEPAADAGSVMLVLRPERVIAWSDAD
jgi:hypothetical protein